MLFVKTDYKSLGILISLFWDTTCDWNSLFKLKYGNSLKRYIRKSWLTLLETIGDLRRKLDKANCNNIQGPRMKEEESDETKQNCNNIHDLVTTKEKEGNH